MAVAASAVAAAMALVAFDGQVSPPPLYQPSLPE